MLRNHPSEPRRILRAGFAASLAGVFLTCALPTLAAQITNAVDGLSVALAWGYVGLRVIHSFVQATRNVIIVRFWVFATASLVLFLLLLRTAWLLAGL